MDKLQRKIDLGGDPPDGKRIREKIEGFRTLRAGWDSHRGSAPVSEQAIRTAIEVINLLTQKNAPVPSASATPDGGICLMWEIGERELELLIDGDAAFDYSVARRASSLVVDHGSLKALGDVESRFIGPFLLQPA